MFEGTIGCEWGRATERLSRSTLHALLRCDIPAIHVAGLAGARECESFLAVVRNAPGRAADTSPMQLVGSNFSNHHGADKHDYFQTVADSRRNLRTLTDASFDPVERVRSQLAAHWPGAVRIADEGPPYGCYFAGCVKTRVAGSALHYDYAPDMVSGYAISDIRAQLSWNVYLQMPSGTGETTLYNKIVDPKRDLREREPGAGVRWNNLVNPGAVLGCESYTFKGRSGELVLFNTRCPHTVSVEAAGEHERRTQIGGFAGLTRSNDLILWS